jgi:hypothetical protein
LLRGQPELALREAEQEKGSIYRHHALALAHTARGDQSSADTAMETLKQVHGEDNPFRVASAYAFRGEVDKVFEWLERAYEAHDPRVIKTASEDLLKPFHDDPRFAAICRRVGFTQPGR